MFAFAGVIAAATLSAPASPARGDAASMCTHVQAYTDGRPAPLCVDQARAAGLTILDLGDDWAPYPLADAAREQGLAPPGYRDTFIDLANARFGDDALAAADRHLELYGIPPSLRLVLSAMDDTPRHRCHDAIDDRPLAALTRPLRREDRDQAATRVRDLAKERARIDRAMRARGVDTRAALLAISPGYGPRIARLERAEAVDGAIRATQAHLACDGLLPPSTRIGTFHGDTRAALASFQRRHWIVASGELDPDTASAFVGDSRELDFRLALRVLRLRVADAAGLIEDGSARNAWRTVLGRQLDPAELRFDSGYPARTDGAEDLISPATEAAALALGWRDFASARDALRAVLSAESTQVAVKLPPPPSYHSSTMEVRAVIACGDAATRADGTPEARRPVLELYARDGARDVVLVRWPTTLGGRKLERLPGGAVVRRNKFSDTGPRVWRDLVVAPAWYAPKSTPDQDLLRLRDGRWSVKEDLIGPGYRSAYGLVMLIHHQPVEHDGHTHMVDHGIRTHGSVSYGSILTADSHGCHRLYNHLAVRLASFLLRHRNHLVRGPIEERFQRRVRGHGRTWAVTREVRGYDYQLDPPVAVDVRASSVARDCAR